MALPSLTNLSSLPSADASGVEVEPASKDNGDTTLSYDDLFDQNKAAYGRLLRGMPDDIRSEVGRFAYSSTLIQQLKKASSCDEVVAICNKLFGGRYMSGTDDWFWQAVCTALGFAEPSRTTGDHAMPPTGPMRWKEQFEKWCDLRLTNATILAAVKETLAADATGAEPHTKYGPIGSWDVSQVTDMCMLFFRATAFNQDIGGWDVSNVTGMRGVFYGAAAFNQDIGGWNVSNVENMDSMFFGATAFDQDIGRWKVSKVENMEGMFMYASAFNQDIGRWTVSKVENMLEMFRGASAFNQDIGRWTVSKVKTMNGMFLGATAFNQDIGTWKVSKVENMQEMFRGASAFNQDISQWDLSRVMNMDDIFLNADAFDQDVRGWQNWSERLRFLQT